MKRANTTDVSSRVQTVEWENSGFSSSARPPRPFRNRSLHVSVRQRETEKPSLPFTQSSEEEHVRHLVTLGEQIGRLAHDIRNPLSSIEWFATLLGRPHLGQSERQELADQCIQAVRYLDQLVSNMLTFSAPLENPQEPVDMSELLNEVELLARYPLQKKRIGVHRRQSGPAVNLKGHEALLKQALLNLLMNAIQASPVDGMIEIHYRKDARVVEWNKKLCRKDGIVLSIRDQGCGMSEAALSQIFRPFYSQREGGTGLGLSIVEQVVHIHQGFIDITSQEGKGTTVELFFHQ